MPGASPKSFVRVENPSLFEAACRHSEGPCTAVMVADLSRMWAFGYLRVHVDMYMYIYIHTRTYLHIYVYMSRGGMLEFCRVFAAIVGV